MSIKIMTRVWDDSPYRGDGLLLHLALADWSDDDGNCWPSQETAAQKVRCSARWVRTMMNRMVEEGYLLIVADSRRGQSRRYALRFPMTGTEFPGTEFRPAGMTGTPEQNDRNSVPQQGANGRNSVPQWEELGPLGNRQEPSLKINRQEPSLPAPPSKPDLFDEFWSAYPRKAQKQAAKKAWDKAIKLASAAEIISAAERLAADPNLPDKQFVPHPATWLNAGGWDDEPLPPRVQHHRGPSAATAREQERAARLNRYREMDASDGWALPSAPRAVEGA